MVHLSVGDSLGTVLDHERVFCPRAKSSLMKSCTFRRKSVGDFLYRLVLRTNRRHQTLQLCHPITQVRASRGTMLGWGTRGPRDRPPIVSFCRAFALV